MITPKLTQDGSQTLFSSVFNEHYHSLNGALAESQHIFIEAGLDPLLKDKKELNILEIGFGTGLNCLLTMLRTTLKEKQINYLSLEAFPIAPDLAENLNYHQIIAEKQTLEYMSLIHSTPWDQKVQIRAFFNLTKLKIKLEEFQTNEKFELVYFDAFSPEVQPELWTEEIFSKIYNLMKPKAVLVTYCAKGYVKRNLKKAGFNVIGLPGPKGKREITKAVKLS